MKKITAFLLTLFISTLPAFAAESGESGSCIENLQSENPQVQIEAAECLGENGGEEAVEPLLEVLKDTENNEVAIASAKALANIKDVPATVTGLISALDSVKDPTAKYGIVAALAALANDDNVADIQAALDRVELQSNDELLKDLAVRVRTLISDS